MARPAGGDPAVTPGRPVACLRPLRVLSWLVLALAAFACSSPNRGTWKGTFAGSVSGSVEFRINSRGTHLHGRMEGQTQDGQPFRASMEGRIQDPYFYATFQGDSAGALIPTRFEGLMKGELAEGKARGTWSATVRGIAGDLEGIWEVDQVADSR